MMPEYKNMGNINMAKLQKGANHTGIGKSLLVSGIECHNSYIVIYALDNRYTDLLSRSTYNIAQTCPETQADAFCM